MCLNSLLRNLLDDAKFKSSSMRVETISRESLLLLLLAVLLVERPDVVAEKEGKFVNCIAIDP